MCGYDTAYALDRGVKADDSVADLARAEERTVITRDADLAERVDDVIFLTEREIRDQLRALQARGIELSLATEPVYCGRCNGPLVAVSPDQPLPEYVPDDFAETVVRCDQCDQHFWRGSHWEDVRETLASL